MEKIMRSILPVFLLLVSQSLFSQGDSIVRKSISDNIKLYHLRHAVESEIGLDGQGYIAPTKGIAEKFFNSRFQLRLDIEKDSLVYPKDHYKVFRIYKKDFVFENDSMAIKHFLYSFLYDDYYLVALDSAKNDIKFLSGNFYLSKIA